MISTRNCTFSEQTTQLSSSSLNQTGKDLEQQLKDENRKFLNQEDDKSPASLDKKYYDEKLKNWKCSTLKDEFRPEYANKSSGGIEYNNKELVSMMRSTGYDMIKLIGKKILSGDFNLTTISFPIKVMIPITILQAIAKSIFQFPIYLKLANMSKDPMEKFKFIITATMACFHQNSELLKPMNPILGETFETMYEDGSKVYLEQTSHHPPVSHYLMIGPNNSYQFSGFSLFKTSAGFNSLKLKNKGKRLFVLNDGTKITATFCNEVYSNTFFGTVRHESLGEIVFKDLTNGYECTLKLDSVKKKPSDFFSGEIKLKNNALCKIVGSYLSYIEFNGNRYWDIRENIPIKMLEIDKHIKSSSYYREDRKLLQEGKLEEAQTTKDKLEEVQRIDRKLREAYEKQIKKHKK